MAFAGDQKQKDKARFRVAIASIQSLAEKKITQGDLFLLNRLSILLGIIIRLDVTIMINLPEQVATLYCNRGQLMSSGKRPSTVKIIQALVSAHQ